MLVEEVEKVFYNFTNKKESITIQRKQKRNKSCKQNFDNYFCFWVSFFAITENRGNVFPPDVFQNNCICTIETLSFWISLENDKYKFELLLLNLNIRHQVIYCFQTKSWITLFRWQMYTSLKLGSTEQCSLSIDVKW